MPDRIYSKFNLNHRITYSTDDAQHFLSSLPSESIKFVITSPPYNVGKEYETKVSIKSYLEKQTSVINELVRVLHPEGSICWEVGNYVDNGEVYPLDIFYYSIFKNCGLKLRNRIIWHFEHGLHATNRFSGRYETILWFTKNDKYTFNLDGVRIPSKYPGKRYYKGSKKGQPSCNPLGKNPSDLWEFIENEWEREIWEIPNVKANHLEKTIHPCQFPVELVERCVLALTNEDDFVLDPYAGVGSTLVAALKHGRRAVGVDKEKKYVDIGKQRIKDFFSGNLKIRPIGKEVYKPTGKEKVARIPDEWRKSETGDIYEGNI